MDGFINPLREIRLSYQQAHSNTNKRRYERQRKKRTKMSGKLQSLGTTGGNGCVLNVSE